MRLGRIALVLVLIAAVAGVGWLIGSSAMGLGEDLTREAYERLGVELSGGRFHWSLDEGLVLEDAEAFATTEGRRYRMELPRVVLELRAWALVTGAAEIRRMALERPRLELVELDSDEPPAATAPAAGEAVRGWPALRFDLEEVLVSDATVLLTGEGAAPEAKLEGVDVLFSELALVAGASDLLGLEGSGDFTARRGAFGDVEIADAQAQIYLHDRKVSLTLLRFQTARAPFVAEMRIELARSPFGYTVSSLGEPFDPAPLLGAAPGSLGEASLLLEVFGRGPRPSGFRAQGSVTLAGGTLGEVPLFEAMGDAVSGDPFQAGAELEPGLVVYRVRDGGVLFEPFELRAGDTVASFRGRSSLDGELELEVELAMPEGAPTSLVVTGSAEHPVIVLP